MNRPPLLPLLPALPPRWRRDGIALALVFLASRAFVLVVFTLRGRGFPFLDAEGYIGHAEWVAAHGSLLMPDQAGARFFSGMPLLVSLLGRLTGEFSWTGLTVNAVMGIGATWLFYRNVGSFRWGAWHACLLPAWVSMTSTFQSEAGTWCFALFGLTLLRTPLADRTRRLGLVIAGYALACRPTAFFILGPMLVFWLLPPRCAWRTALLDGLAVGVLPTLLAIWTWLDTGHFFPQAAFQAREFAHWSEVYGGGFPTGIFAWPGESFLAGFSSSAVRTSIKAMNFAHFVAWALALLLAGRAWRKDRSDGLAALTTLELAVNGAFVLSMGGPYGHTIFYRYLATQANAFVLLAWLRYTRLPAPLWWTASAASVILASAVARGN